VALRLGLSEEDAGCLAFLVREHLLLALLAQTRDIYNETTLRHLAREVGDRRTLALLYLLTWGDMSSANPELLTNWKSALLEELYRRTDTLLSSGLGVYADLRNVVHERRVEVLEMLLGEPPEHPSIETLEVDRFFGHLATRYFVMTQAEQVLVHMEMLRQLDARPAVVRLDKQSGGLSLVTVICRDSPGMLARLTGVLAAHRVNIIGAEVHSRTDGSVIDVFEVERPKHWDRLAHDLAGVVSGEVNPETLLRKRERPSKLGAKATPPIKTEVRVDLSASESSTVIDVIARDRPGLLYRVARALHHLGLDIQLARITTEGPSARDAFYVTWISGKKVTNKEQLERMVESVRKAIDAPL
jgi:[protein-PII] uridylyltransferase